jgi:NADH dehydrogenase FAD-containing subunit
VQQCCYCAGLAASTGRQRQGFPFPVATGGSTATDATLRVEGHPRVFAIGDTATAAPPTTVSAEEAAAASTPTAQVRL